MVIEACRREFAAAWQRATAEESTDRVAYWLRLKAGENEAAAAELWRRAAELGLSRPGCFARRNDLPTGRAD